jgi:hypothetical protein
MGWMPLHEVGRDQDIGSIGQRIPPRVSGSMDRRVSNQPGG